MLSGYLIAGSVFRTIERGIWSWKRYLLHRGLRLWIVLIPGLLLCLLWDQIGLRANLAPLLYHGQSSSHMLPDVQALGSAANFFRNLFFLQVVTGSTFGSDGALWSLAFEFWYYLLFPLGLLAVLPRTPLRQRVLYAVLFVVTALFVGRRIMESFPVWLAGAGLARVPTRSLPAWIRWLSSVVYIVPFFLIARVTNHYEPTHLWIGLAGDYVLTLLTFGWVWILLGATSAAKGSAGEHAARELSRFSFTLYVAHTPLLVLIMALLAGDMRWQPDVRHLLFGAGIFALLLAYSYGVAWLTEFRTDTLRSYLERRLGLEVRRTAPLDRVHAVDPRTV